MPAMRHTGRSLMKWLFYGPVLAWVLATLPAFSQDLEVPGIPNFHQVDEHIYRGGQPRADAWSGLAKLGVKVVVDLRRENEHSTAAEAQAVEAAGMQYVNVPMHGVVAPSDEEVSAVLALLDASGSSPVFVHCKRGADRTGAVIACYRMIHDHWSNRKAMQEAKSLGMSWTQIGIKRYIADFQAANFPVRTKPAATASQAKAAVSLP
jgi:tyrosine-protein phosphatase SIW14